MSLILQVGEATALAGEEWSSHLMVVGLPGEGNPVGDTVSLLTRHLARSGDLAAALSQSLSTVLEQTAVALKLEEAQFGIKVAPLTDKSLLETAQFVLAVQADLTTEDIRRRLPAQIKLGPVEHIRDLVNNHLPGIGISALPVAPRQIPFHAGYHYFLLDNKSERWEQLKQSGGLALHVSGNYPGLKLELWAIRQ